MELGEYGWGWLGSGGWGGNRGGHRGMDRLMGGQGRHVDDQLPFPPPQRPGASPSPHGASGVGGGRNVAGAGAARRPSSASGLSPTGAGARPGRLSSDPSPGVPSQLPAVGGFQGDPEQEASGYGPLLARCAACAWLGPGRMIVPVFSLAGPGMSRAPGSRPQAGPRGAWGCWGSGFLPGGI